ncbi:MAG: dihydroneopterin aldolase [Acidobacteriota bacterium]
MPDKVFISGIRFHGFHGLTQQEREMGMRFSVDVEMERDLSIAAEKDGLNNTIDYRKVHQLVVEIGRKESHSLIERLAGRIVSEVMKRFSVDRVTVKVRKETPVLDGIVDHVGVELTRERNPGALRKSYQRAGSELNQKAGVSKCKIKTRNKIEIKTKIKDKSRARKGRRISR